MKFRSRRDLFVHLIIYGAIAIMFVPQYPLIEGVTGPGEIAIVIFCLIVSGMLLWILYGTWYTIDKKYITYCSGPLRGKIEIVTIHTVISGKNLYVGYRPATATKGVILKYGKYDDIYFSPETNETFIAELLKINPSIKVEKYKSA